MFDFNDAHGPAPVAQVTCSSGIHSSINHLKREIARYLGGAERFRELVKALELASVAELKKPRDERLHWPHLLQVLEGAMPEEVGVERALRWVEEAELSAVMGDGLEYGPPPQPSPSGGGGREACWLVRR